VEVEAVNYGEKLIDHELREWSVVSYEEREELGVWVKDLTRPTRLANACVMFKLLSGSRSTERSLEEDMSATIEGPQRDHYTITNGSNLTARKRCIYCREGMRGLAWVWGVLIWQFFKVACVAFAR
jgi:hypothetical protein